jgi:hypothetical protein
MKTDPTKRNRTLLLGLPAIPVVALMTFAACLLASPRGVAADAAFVRGDINVDGQISSSDLVMLRRYLFLGGEAPPCKDAADADDDGALDLGDGVSILRRLLLGGEAFPSPYPAAGEDPTADTWSCEAYEVVPPEETGDSIRLGDVSAGPGQQVSIPVYITSDRETEAFQLVVSYDPAVFTPLTYGDPSLEGQWVEPPWPEILEGSINEALYKSVYLDRMPGGRRHICGLNVHIVTPYPEEGVFTLAFVPSLTCLGYELPPGTDMLAFNILGTVSESAPVGTTITLEPTNGTDGAGFGPDKLRNELTYMGEASYFSIIPETFPGILRVVPDIAIFIRGDANSDATVDLSDPVSTLGFLFLGEAEPPCLDAADSNDDGRLDISDPVTTLTYLFLGGAPLPAPVGTPAVDPTSDALHCLTGPGSER